MHFPRLIARRPAPLAALALAAICAATLLAGCGSASGSGPLLAAQVSGHGIALSDYQGILKFYEAENAQQLAQTGGQQGTVSDWQSLAGRQGLANIQQSALNMLISIELERKELAANNITVSQADLNTAASQLDTQIKSLQQQQKNNPAIAAVVASLTPRVRQLFVEQQVYETALMAKVKVPVAHVRAILVDTQAQAQSLEQQAAKGADFGQLAKAHSQDTQSAANNGELGTVYVGQLNPAFDAAAFGTKSPSKYVVVPVNGKYALFEVTQQTSQPVSKLNDTQTEQTVLSAWLTSVVQPQAQVQTFVTIG